MDFLWLKYFTDQLVPVLCPNYKQHILLPAEVIHKLNFVLSVYLNLFVWRGRDVN
jgi:hypothetical protein